MPGSDDETTTGRGAPPREEPIPTKPAPENRRPPIPCRCKCRKCGKIEEFSLPAKMMEEMSRRGGNVLAIAERHDVPDNHRRMLTEHLCTRCQEAKLGPIS